VVEGVALGPESAPVAEGRGLAEVELAEAELVLAVGTLHLESG